MLSEIEVVKRKLMNNATEEYDAVVSLGGSCASCLNIRKRFLQTYAYPFDYVFCVDAQFQFRALAELFRTDFRDWLRRENIIPLEKEERGISDLYQYKDRLTEYRYIHDFKRPVEAEGSYEEFLAKYQRRRERLYRKIEDSQKVLFVSDAVSRLKAADVRCLLGVLEKKWPGKTFDLAILNFGAEKDEIVDERHVKVVNLKRPKNNYDYFGMNYEWSYILDSVKLSAPLSAPPEKETFVGKVKKFLLKKRAVQKDDVFFITGCSSGIGRSLCELLLQRGYRVVATARSKDSISQLGEGRPGRVLCLELDVTDADMVKTAIANAIKAFGRIDVLVNNAGIGYFSVVEGIEAEKARQVLDVNLIGAINVIKAVLPHMRGRNRGLVVNVSSIAALEGKAAAGVYAASKAALEKVSQSAREELADTGIDVVSLEYGETESGFYKNSIVDQNVPDGYAETAGAALKGFAGNVFYNPQTAFQAAERFLNVLENNGGLPSRLLIGNEVRDFAKNVITGMKHDFERSIELTAPYVK